MHMNRKMMIDSLLLLPFPLFALELSVNASLHFLPQPLQNIALGENAWYTQNRTHNVKVVSPDEEH